MNSNELGILGELNQIKSELERWGKKVDDILINQILPPLIKTNCIKYLPEHRLKDDVGYVIKALYRGKNYTDPLVEIEDKVGTRVVVLKSSDIYVITELIKDYHGWKARLDRDIRNGIDDKPKEFDYQSVHFILKPLDSDNSFSEELKPKLTCELQIRTLLQHAFAEVSHDSTYKGPYKNDKEIIRKLARSMALMEATDEYFSEIFKSMTDENRYYNLYITTLFEWFKKFVPDFTREELDIDITDDIFKLFSKIKVDVLQVEHFINKNELELKKQINPKYGLIFRQPIVLLILYYFENHYTFISGSDWPLSMEVLDTIYSATGRSAT